MTTSSANLSISHRFAQFSGLWFSLENPYALKPSICINHGVNKHGIIPDGSGVLGVIKIQSDEIFQVLFAINTGLFGMLLSCC